MRAPDFSDARTMVWLETRQRLGCLDFHSALRTQLAHADCHFSNHQGATAAHIPTLFDVEAEELEVSNRRLDPHETTSVREVSVVLGRVVRGNALFTCRADNAAACCRGHVDTEERSIRLVDVDVADRTEHLPTEGRAFAAVVVTVDILVAVRDQIPLSRLENGVNLKLVDRDVFLVKALLSKVQGSDEVGAIGVKVTRASDVGFDNASARAVTREQFNGVASSDSEVLSNGAVFEQREGAAECLRIGSTQVVMVLQFVDLRNEDVRNEQVVERNDDFVMLDRLSEDFGARNVVTRCRVIRRRKLLDVTPRR